MVSNLARHDRDMLCALEMHRQSRVITRVAGVKLGNLKAEKGGTGGTPEEDLPAVRYRAKHRHDKADPCAIL